MGSVLTWRSRGPWCHGRFGLAGGQSWHYIDGYFACKAQMQKYENVCSLGEGDTSVLLTLTYSLTWIALMVIAEVVIDLENRFKRKERGMEGRSSGRVEKK